MSLKMKLLIGFLIAVCLIVATYFVVNGIASSAIRKAKEQIENLNNEMNGLRDSMATRESYWQDREKELVNKANYLNSQISKLQRERNVLENTIKELRRQRAEITVPDNPDDIVKQFRDAGFSSRRIKYKGN